MEIYDETLTVKEALAQFFQRFGIPEDAYTAKYFTLAVPYLLGCCFGLVPCGRRGNAAGDRAPICTTVLSTNAQALYWIRQRCFYALETHCHACNRHRGRACYGEYRWERRYAKFLPKNLFLGSNLPQKSWAIP